MVTSEELIVSIKSEGVEKTEKDLDNVEKSMSDTAEQTDDSASRLEGFSEKLKGAMAAVVASLAVAAAGIMSQIPVLGEVMSGFKAVVSAIGLQLDDKLRPALTKVTDNLFELANAINKGDYNQAKKEIKDIINVFDGSKIRGFTDQFMKIRDELVGEFANLFGQFVEDFTADDAEKASKKVIGLFKRSMSSLIEATDWSEFMVDVLKFLAIASEGLAKAWYDEVTVPIVQGIINGLANLAQGVIDWFDDLALDIQTWAQSVADDAVEMGKNIIEGLIKGIQSMSGAIADELEGIKILGPMFDDINQEIQDINPEQVADDVASAFDGAGGERTTGGAGTRVSDPKSTTTTDAGGNSIYLDGRDLSGSTGRYRSDPARRRGI